MSALDTLLKNIENYVGKLETSLAVEKLIAIEYRISNFNYQFEHVHIPDYSTIFHIETTLFCVIQGNGIKNGANIFDVLAIKYSLVETETERYFQFERRMEWMKDKQYSLVVVNKGIKRVKAKEYPVSKDHEIAFGAVNNAVYDMLDTL